MLIQSPRHTEADLRLWESMAVKDRLSYRLLRVEDKARLAVRTLQEFCNHRSTYVGVSWGKDSVVAAHLTYRAAIPRNRLMHLQCSNRTPDIDCVADVYLDRFRQDIDIVNIDYGGLHRQDIADDLLNELTDSRWFGAIRRYEKESGGGRILGIRADESPGRKVRMKRWGAITENACAPIGWWSAEDVFAYLAHHDLPIHPAYAMTGGGQWDREWIRVAEIGDTHGKRMGRHVWEEMYYGDIYHKVTA